MNKVLVLLLVAVTSIPETLCMSKESQKLMMDVHEACIVESGVAPDVIQKMMGGDFTDDPKLKDHFMCFAKKEGLMNDSGEVMMDAVKAKIHSYIEDDAKAEEVITKCVVMQATPKETAFQFSKCMFGLVSM
ncbi:hypothetical protein JTB14_004574 [Gonioctena quinquepunctata]|nr:hypothetical protein JTB14_004574 [Gonioctena quinquepunctata]